MLLSSGLPNFLVVYDKIKIDNTIVMVIVSSKLLMKIICHHLHISCGKTESGFSRYHNGVNDPYRRLFLATVH